MRQLDERALPPCPVCGREPRQENHGYNARIGCHSSIGVMHDVWIYAKTHNAAATEWRRVFPRVVAVSEARGK